uniref:(northern house mosquito) hypothetical protein n=1 Tax=Culex pipiens TaxID=7175 RepID=A0A8D8BZ28_CULPI
MRDRAPPPDDDSEEDDVSDPTVDGASEEEEDEITIADRRDRLSLALSKMFSDVLLDDIRWARESRSPVLQLGALFWRCCRKCSLFQWAREQRSGSLAVRRGICGRNFGVG